MDGGGVGGGGDCDALSGALVVVGAEREHVAARGSHAQAVVAQVARRAVGLEVLAVVVHLPEVQQSLTGAGDGGTARARAVRAVQAAPAVHRGRRSFRASL